jgi:hypothetical protein
MTAKYVEKMPQASLSTEHKRVKRSLSHDWYQVDDEADVTSPLPAFRTGP